MDRISIIEDILIEQAKLALESATVETRTTPLTEQGLNEMIGSAPFCYIEYTRSLLAMSGEGGSASQRRIYFNLFVAAKSLRSREEAQRGSYALLEALRKRLDGKDFPLSTDPTKRAGPFQWENEDVLFDSPNGGTVYMQVFSTLDSTYK